MSKERTINSGHGWFRSPPVIGLLLFVATAAAYLPVYRSDFVNYDDDLYVFANHHVSSGLSLQGLWWAVTTFHASNWHPLTWISLQLDAEFYGLKPSGFHLTNLFLHAVNTAVLFLVLRRATGAMWRSAIVAALFGLHPLHVESVAWITERKDVLSTLFWILTIALYLRFIERPGFGNYLLVFLSFALGLAAKPMLVTLPFVILLLDYWPLGLLRPRAAISVRLRSLSSAPMGRDWSRLQLFALILPLLALTAASSALTIAAQSSGGAVQSLEQLPLGSRLGNALVAYVRYFGKTLWPSDLSIFYPYERDQNLVWQLAAGVMLLAISALVLMQKRRPYLFVGWFWYIGTLVPVIGIVQVGLHALADRYTYIPLIGLFIALVWAGAELLEVLRVPQQFRFGLATSLLVLAAVLTRAQVHHWHDSIALWSHALEVDPENYVAHTSLGPALSSQGKVEEAMRHYEAALKSNPRDLLAHVNLAAVLQSRGQLKEAVGHYLDALRIRPRTAPWHYQAGVLLVAMGNSEQGIVHLSQALELRPDSVPTRLALAEELVHRGRPEEAERHLQEAAGRMPRNPAVYHLRGLLLCQRGMFRQAVEAYHLALQQRPTNAAYHVDLAYALTKLDDTRSASAEYQQALQLDPHFPEAVNRQAWTYATHPDHRIRDGARAVQLAERACQATDFRAPEFLDTLAAAHAELGHFRKAEVLVSDALGILRRQGVAPKPELEARLQLYHRHKPFRTLS